MVCGRVIESIADYQEAIRISCDILNEECNVDCDYYDAIMENIHNYGSYFYLGDGVCMPHARVRQNIKEAALCVLKVRKPVNFQGENVFLFFTLAAKDEDSHMDLLKRISSACSSKENLQAMMDCEDKDKLLSMI